MNTLLYNNRNGCFKICNTCNIEDIRYKAVLYIYFENKYSVYISTDWLKKNEVYETPTFGGIQYWKNDGTYWYYKTNFIPDLEWTKFTNNDLYTIQPSIKCVK